MLTAALISLGVVFVAELGDKSQLMSMTYALRHRWWVVLSGVAVAAFLVHGLAVTVGHFLGLNEGPRSDPRGTGAPVRAAGRRIGDRGRGPAASATARAPAARAGQCAIRPLRAVAAVRHRTGLALGGRRRHGIRGRPGGGRRDRCALRPPGRSALARGCCSK